MRSATGWARLLMGGLALAFLGLVGCEEDDAVFGPLNDEVPPSVSITNVTAGPDTLTVSVQAEDFISVAFVVTELRRTDVFETIVTPEGDTLVLGRLLAVDTAHVSGRATSFTVTTTFFHGFAQATVIDIRAVGVDAQGNEGFDISTVLVGGGGTGGGLGGPQVQITSPLPNSTVRSNTLVRVGVSASDPTGLQQLNVVLSGITPAAQPPSDTIRFAEFRTNVDTLLDFFVPQGASGPLTITAEAINLNTISGFAQITVTVSEQVSNDTIRPTVSMLVSGGVQRRPNEPPRMEIDDSLLFNIVALDNETAITRVGVSIAVLNQTDAGAATTTITRDSVMDPAISGTVPVTFAITPGDADLASVFSAADVPDTLFFDVTAWAFDAAGGTGNCGATVDPNGTPNNLQCTSGTPIQAVGLQGGRVERLIVSGSTVGFPQGALIADAIVDTVRQRLILSDFNFGVLRPFDLTGQAFLANVPVGSQPWGVALALGENEALVSNSGGTNISVVDLIALAEIDRFQTQDLKVYRVREDFDAVGQSIYPVTFFEYSDRPQFLAQAANQSILFSTVPALADLPGTIREYDPIDREIRFFIAYANRIQPSQPEIQVVNADSVFSTASGREFIICDHTRGDPSPAARSCVTGVESVDASALVNVIPLVIDRNTNAGWDVDIFSDLDIPSIGLQDTTFVVASGNREFVAFGEGDTPERSGRVILYRSATRSISNALQVSDLPGNAEQRVFGLALNRDGTLGVGRGNIAYFFGPDQQGGNENVLRLLGVNDNINPLGTGAALHPDHDLASSTDESRRLAFLGAGDARIEIVDTQFFSFSRGQILIRDPIVGPLRITRRLPGDPPEVVLKLYGVTANGVVVIPVNDTDIIPIP